MLKDVVQHDAQLCTTTDAMAKNSHRDKPTLENDDIFEIIGGLLTKYTIYLRVLC